MKKYILLIAVLFSALHIFSQTTAIPDANFEQALIDLGHDSGTPDGVVLTSNINTVEMLNIPSRNISDLTGIEDFTSLLGLSCWDNDLTSLDISQNLLLDFLGCADNSITSIDVSNNINLGFLRADGNSLSSIDVTMLPNLYHIQVDYNPELSSLDLSQNPLLNYIYCQNYGESTSIASLILPDNASIMNLYCGRNQLTELIIPPNTVFTNEFRCAINQISGTIDLSNSELLNWVVCNNNQISEILLPAESIALNLLQIGGNPLTGDLDVSSYPNLYRLQCGGAQLASLNVANGNNTNFTIFECADNPGLSCITVDDISWSNANWTEDNYSIDSHHFFSIDCSPGVFGCTDSLACNYDPLADTDDGTCSYDDADGDGVCDDDEILGCTFTVACNYNSAATDDDGEQCDYTSCYVFGCTNTFACNYDPLVDYYDGTCEYTSCIDNCQGPDFNNDGVIGAADLIVFLTYYGNTLNVAGCTDIAASNYNPNATEDDGTCIILVGGCTLPFACNYDPNADFYLPGSCDFSCLFGSISN